MKRNGINWRTAVAAAGGAVVLLVAAGAAAVRVRKVKNGPLTGENTGDPAAEQARWRGNSSS